jgi:hypothetical protein
LLLEFGPALGRHRHKKEEIMPPEALFPPLIDWEPTRQTLQLYSRVVSAVPRALAAPQPHWWHISLHVNQDGLTSSRMRLPAGGEFWLTMDLHRHQVLLLGDRGLHRSFNMANGRSASAFGDQVLGAVKELGLEGPFQREKFESDEPRIYDAAAAARFFQALTSADRIFKAHRARLSGEVSPVQLWSHGFDLSVEWFGTRVERYEEHGKIKEFPSQLNLGFYPGDPENAPYFYSNPWPFEGERLLDKGLPRGARWHTEGWQGTILPYEEIAGDERAEERLLEYARRVYEVCAPTLTTG